jgi:hypothetical protein
VPDNHVRFVVDELALKQVCPRVCSIFPCQSNSAIAPYQFIMDSWKVWRPRAYPQSFIMRLHFWPVICLVIKQESQFIYRAHIHTLPWRQVYKRATETCSVVQKCPPPFEDCEVQQFWLGYSGLEQLVLWLVSEISVPSFFCPEEEGSMFLRTFVNIYQTTRFSVVLNGVIIDSTMLTC